MTSGSHHEQIADLMELLADEGTYRIVARLLEGEATAEQLIDSDVAGLNQSGVSKRLRELRLAGLVDGRGGRNAVHHIKQAAEIVALLRSALGLAEAINQARQEHAGAQRRQLAATEMRLQPELDGRAQSAE